MNSLGYLRIQTWAGYKNYCIDKYSFDNNYLYFHDVITNKNYKTNQPYTLVWGYDYNSTSKRCYLKQDLQKTGLTFYDYNFLIGLSGILVGFIVLYSLILLSFNVVRRD